MAAAAFLALCVAVAGPSVLEPADAAPNVLEPADAVPVDDRIEAALAAKLSGCEQVFIDAGANIGMHARFLFEPEAYKNSSFISVFDSELGNATQRRKTTCAIEFEPNPEHKLRLSKLAAAYKKVGWRVVIAPYGVGDRRSTLTFHSDVHSANEDWGFGARPTGADYGTLVKPVEVTMVDFPRFLQLLSERPPPSGGQLGKTVIKMDIESSEYTVIPSMIERGSLCNHVDFISVEWHARFAPIKFFDRHFGSSKSRDEAQQLGGMLRDMVSDSAYACRTKGLKEIDDETYMHDLNDEQHENPQPFAVL